MLEAGEVGGSQFHPPGVWGGVRKLIFNLLHPNPNFRVDTKRPTMAAVEVKREKIYFEEEANQLSHRLVLEVLDAFYKRCCFSRCSHRQLSLSRITVRQDLAFVMSKKAEYHKQQGYSIRIGEPFHYDHSSTQMQSRPLTKVMQPSFENL